MEQSYRRATLGEIVGAVGFGLCALVLHVAMWSLGDGRDRLLPLWAANGMLAAAMVALLGNGAVAFDLQIRMRAAARAGLRRGGARTYQAFSK